MAYYRTPAGGEIDFIVETRRCQSGNPPHVAAIEVKRAEKWDSAWNKPLRELATLPGLKVERLFGVYMGQRAYELDGIQVLPLTDFCRALHRDRVS